MRTHGPSPVTGFGGFDGVVEAFEFGAGVGGVPGEFGDFAGVDGGAG